MFKIVCERYDSLLIPLQYPLLDTIGKIYHFNISPYFLL
ncbi:hypothetical protein MNB_SV-6-1454 [hydrothermal vent metagenome]|uniref:Uncharacterized protein n=1 Tax=hydrothermal vent metagenome TaxID=652676 RepID=A0A1W1BC34_9ZZZZ